MKKKISRFLLITALIASMFAVFAFTATAADGVKKYSVTGWREFSEALAAPGNAEITLKSDVLCSHDFASTGHTTAKVNGNKVVNLNGHTLGCNDSSNAKFNKNASGHGWFVDCYTSTGNTKTLIEISKDSSLTIDDTSGNNSKVFFTGYTIDATTGSYEHIHYSAFTVRDLFIVNGTLTVNAGNLVAGNVKVQNVTYGADYDEFGKAFQESYWGDASQQVWGTVATINAGGKVVINGGSLSGRGYAGDLGAGAGSYTVTTDRDAVLDFKGGKAEINGGKITGYGGADVLGGNASGNVVVSSGIFETYKEGHVRVKDFHSSNGKYYAAVVPDNKGVIGLSDDAINEKYKGNLKVTLKGKSYTDYDEITGLELYETSDSVKIELTNYAHPLLTFDKTVPEIKAGKKEHEFEVLVGTKVDFEFNTAPLSKTLEAQGYTVKKAYAIRDDATKDGLDSKGNISGNEVEKFSFTFDTVGRYEVALSASLYEKNGTRVGSIGYTYYVKVVTAEDYTGAGTGSSGTGTGTGTGTTDNGPATDGTYKITVKGGSAEGASGRVMRALPGTKIKLVVDNFSLPYGKVLDKWIFTSETTASLTSDGTYYYFTMPSGNVSIEATYKAKESAPQTGTDTGTTTVTGPYSITVKGGYAETASGRVTKANPGEKIKLVVDNFSLPSGKVLDTWVFQSEISATLTFDGTYYTFTMPNGKVSLAATYKDKPSASQSGTEEGSTVTGPYSITVKGGYAETSSGRVMKANPGEKIKLVVDNFSMPSGKVLDEWVFQSEISASLNFDGTYYTFKMPNGNVSITATYKDKPAASQTEEDETVVTGPFGITVKGGYAEASSGRVMKANPGEKIKLVVDNFSTPAGKVLDTWEFTSEKTATLKFDGTNYYFTMPKGAVSLAAVYKDKNAATSGNTGTPETAKGQFADVPESEWYYNDVKNAVAMGLVNGKSATEYKPEDNLTYAEAVKLAACMHQLYTDGAVTLKNGTVNWYDTYVDYCVDNGIIDKEYNYDDYATRAGYMVIFANALPDEALEKINNVPDSSIPDVPMTRAYSKAVYKLYRAGILQGSDAAHNCKPLDNIKRSEVAAILSRMMDKTKRVKFSMDT